MFLVKKFVPKHFSSYFLFKVEMKTGIRKPNKPIEQVLIMANGCQWQVGNKPQNCHSATINYMAANILKQGGHIEKKKILSIKNKREQKEEGKTEHIL